MWEWLFESHKHSSLYSHPSDQLAGYTNASTKERINWAQVKECATYLSTALVKQYGMQEGYTVLLFSQNTIWYPVTMLAAIRAGGLNSRYAFSPSQCHPLGSVFVRHCTWSKPYIHSPTSLSVFASGRCINRTALQQAAKYVVPLQHITLRRCHLL